MRSQEWQQATIGSLLVQQYPGAWGEDPSDNSFNALVLRSTNLDDDGHVNLATGAPRIISATDLSNKRLQDGDILLEASGGSPEKPVGRVALFKQVGDQPYLCSNFFRTLRFDTRQVSPSFMAWKLHRLHSQPTIMRYQQQTTGIINLKYMDYLAQEISLPSLREQQQIAEILGSVDDEISVSDAAIAKLKLKASGLMRDLLDSIDCPPMLLANFLAIKPRNGFSPNEVDSWTGTAVLGLGCLTPDGFVPRQIKPVPAKDPRYAGAWLADGDLLISRANTFDLVGLVGRYRDVGMPCVYPDLMMRLVPNSLVRPDFLEITLRNVDARQQIKRMSQGTSGSMVKIGSGAVMGLKVKIPDLQEQDRILSIYGTNTATLRAKEREIAKLRLLKQGLMDDLLTGRVRVNG